MMVISMWWLTRSMTIPSCCVAIPSWRTTGSRFALSEPSQTAAGSGRRLICTTHVAGETKPHQQIDEVRSGGSYISQSDLRVHFGLGKAEKVDVMEIRWPSGHVDTLKDVKGNQLIFVKEGEGISRTVQFDKDEPGK